MSNDKYYQKLIHTGRWVKLREHRLTEHPMCERCLKEGRKAFAAEVHHVIPVESGHTKQEKERLMFDYFNLQALCHRCHVQTHTEMGRSGKPFAERKRKNDIEKFKQKFLNVPTETLPAGSE